MTRTEHLRKLLAGETVRPAVSCWYHFPPEFHVPERAAAAHLRHLERFDLDFLKVLNEADYPRAALGAARTVRSVADLRRLRPLPGDTPPLNQQVELVARLAGQLRGSVPMTVTIFHAWMTLRSLTVPPKDQHSPPVIDVRDDPRDILLTRWLREDASAVRAALEAIAATLADLARRCLEAGADGIYLATRDDWMDTPENSAALRDAAPMEADAAASGAYDRLVAPTDHTILHAAGAGWFNVLHLCGRPVSFERHLGDPRVHVVHWADRVTGPSIAVARTRVIALPGDRRPALAGGVNNLQTLPCGQPSEVAAEVRDAIAAAAGYPLIVAPGCTYDPRAVADENIRAVVAAARG